jgi:Na+/H+ antiporter NhaC
MSDKFKVNSRIVVPAAIVVMIIYLVIGINSSAEIEVNDFKAYKIIPYILVIAAAVFGLNVLIVLVLGIILSSTIGLIDGSFDIFECLNAMSRGMIKMSELIIMTLLAAGMLAIIKQNGGIDYIISKLTKGVSGKRSAEYSIALLVILVNICTANNTVAIITTGPIARDIADKYSVDRRKSASILDTCSCFTQGILPYGAQMIMAAGMAGISAISVISNLYYNMAIIVAVALAIAFRYPRKYSI